MNTTIRRVILRHTAGPHPGLRQILGTADHDTYPPEVPPAALWPDQRVGSAHLERVARRYALYREVA